MEVLAFLHHSIAYEHPEAYELQWTWEDLKTIPKNLLSTGLSTGLLQPAPSFNPLVSANAGYLLGLLGGLAVLATPDVASATLLTRGSYGAEVQQLQYALHQAGYFYGPFTGFYGSLTQQAVMNFQYDFGLMVDGVVGTQTLNALYRTSVGPVGGGNLQFGMHGSDVVDLQYSLANAGYFNGPFTGYFGGLTESAVKALQRDYGLAVDGVVGPSTRAALAGVVRPAATGTPGTLRFGTTGPAVNQLQRDLAIAGFYSGPFTEYFGELTEGAVLQLQSAYGLTPDGIVGPKTQAALSQAIAGTEPAAPPIATAPSQPPAPEVAPAPEPAPEVTPEPEPVETPTAEAEPTPELTPGIRPVPTPAPTAEAEPTPEPTPDETTAVTPRPEPEEGPLPAGFVELQTELQAYDQPGGTPIESGYPLNPGQVIGFAEDQGDGWIRIVGARNGEDAWIFAGSNYEDVEFRNGTAPEATVPSEEEVATEPEQPAEPDEPPSTVVPPVADAPTPNFFVGPTAVEVAQPLTVYTAPGGDPKNGAIASGETLRYVAATPDCWVLVRDEAGQSSWVFAGQSFGALKFVNESLPGVTVSPPNCRPSATAP
jgi:peptidoglycan hydrolase-like protein with peptidoglycan-binding domain